MLESGQYDSSTQLAEAEKVDRANLSRLLLLTLLAPDIVTAILDGNQPPALSISELKKPFPVEWPAQRVLWGFPSPQDKILLKDNILRTVPILKEYRT